MAGNDEESDLDRMALDEITQEAKRGKERAETMGPMGWIKCPLVPTNKRFFRNVLMGTLRNQKQHRGMKERKHEKQNSAKDRKSSASDPPSSPTGSSEDKREGRKTNDKYEHTLQSYSSLKYQSEGGSSLQETSEDNYERNTKDQVPHKGFCRRHISESDEEEKNDHKKSKKSRKDDVAEKRTYRNRERYDNEKPHTDKNYRKKQRLEKHIRKRHKSHKHKRNKSESS